VCPTVLMLLGLKSTRCIAECLESGLIICLRQSVLGCVGTPFERSRLRSLLFFGNVNQVLVRLWARVMRGLSSDGLSTPLFSRLV
jgi:hypothetical protein